MDVGTFVKLSNSRVICPDLGSSIDDMIPKGEINCTIVLFSKLSDSKTEFSVYLIALKGINTQVVSFSVIL